jgi:hypothetical protein
MKVTTNVIKHEDGWMKIAQKKKKKKRDKTKFSDPFVHGGSNSKSSLISTKFSSTYTANLAKCLLTERRLEIEKRKMCDPLRLRRGSFLFPGRIWGFTQSRKWQPRKQ